MKRLIFFIIIAFHISAKSQDVINTERPGEIQSPRVINKKSLQLEGGYFRKEHYPFVLQRFPELHFRYGLSKAIELRLNLVNETQSWNRSIDADGFHPIEPGVKWRLGQSRDSSLSYALQAHIGVPWVSSGKHNPRHPYYKARFIIQGQLTDFWDMNVNFGRDWDHEDFEQNWIYGFAFEFEMGRKFKSMLEFFGHSAFLYHTNELRTGIGYIIGRNFAIDASFGIGLNEISPDYTVGAGISWRLVK